MRKILLFLTFVAIAATNFMAHATDTCVDAICTDITGRVLDPHGNPIAGAIVFGNGANSYHVETTSDAAGNYALHLMNSQAYKGCFLLAAKPDMFYALGSVGGVCNDAVVNIGAAYRVAAQAPKGREFFYPDPTKPVGMDLEIWANSHTFPAPFDKDNLTWTVTDHPAGEATKHVAQEGIFTNHTVTKIGDVYRYLWTTHITVQPHGTSMVHVDWGLHSVFASMMDCRMLWFGFGMTHVSPTRVLPGQVVTVDGIGFGTQVGRIYMQINQGKQAGYIDASDIVSWTPTRVQFIVPTYASSGYFRVWNASGLGPPCLGSTIGTPSPRTWIDVDPEQTVNEIHV